MADFSFGGTDEENAELKKLNAEVVMSFSHLSSHSWTEWLTFSIVRRYRQL
jgi:hypothetical protein